MGDELGWAGMRRRIDWWDPCLTEIDGWGRTPTALGSLHGLLEEAPSGCAGEPSAPAICFRDQDTVVTAVQKRGVVASYTLSVGSLKRAERCVRVSGASRRDCRSLRADLRGRACLAPDFLFGDIDGASCATVLPSIIGPSIETVHVVWRQPRRIVS
jgi:hypothetical protein